MSNTPNSKIDNIQTLVYEIRIKGHLGSQWTDWFEGLTITLEDSGDTLLTCLVTDQAALYGLLKKVRDLGMPLVSVRSVEPGPQKTLGTGQMVFADIFSFMYPGSLQQIMTGCEKACPR